MMKEPNHAEPGLRYLRLVDSLRTRIVDGVYHPGERLPRQHDFARENNVSFTTLKRALDILEDEGYVLRKEGHGTYISIPDRRVPTALVIDDEEGIRGGSPWPWLKGDGTVCSRHRVRRDWTGWGRDASTCVSGPGDAGHDRGRDLRPHQADGV